MFPALPDRVPEAIPADLNARPFADVERLLPALVRKSSQSAWSASSDLDIAAKEVFNENDGIHSFYLVESRAAFVAVATSLSRGGDKPFKRAAYLFVLPQDVVNAHSLQVTEEPSESPCVQLNLLHRHVVVNEPQKQPVFEDIQRMGCFNFRVDRRSMLDLADQLRSRNCREYTSGPCQCEAASAAPSE